MSQATIEHVNLTVGDSNRTAQMMTAIFDWKIRWQGAAQRGGWTVHVGDESNYLALWSAAREGGEVLVHNKGRPLNHVGIVVEDLDEIERRVRDHGLQPFGHDDYEPGRRCYFLDADGIEFEVVSYAPDPGRAS